MDDQECYEWGELFDREWDSMVAGMSARADTMGLTQAETERVLVWQRENQEECRWVFIDDPSDIARVRAVYADEDNVKSRSCFVVVKQNDPSDRRGEKIFDVFRLSPESYLWHYNRVYTQPERAVG